VTGASRGIGAATARALADAGWAIAVNYRSDEDGANAVVEEIEQTGGIAVAMCADVSQAEDVERLFSLLEERFRRVLVLVNNAGIRADGLVVQSRKDDSWQKLLDTNLTATYRTCQRALMPMVRARFGRIVNIASVVGPNVGNPGQANYAATKAGVVGFTRSLAREVAHRGVTANAIAPGFVDTGMTKDLDPELLRVVPARRAGAPEEIAACVQFLISSGASYVTGTTLTVDGGMTA
jgi:3-oxoacyl-[acyl-carrier protein] reductase